MLKGKKGNMAFKTLFKAFLLQGFPFRGFNCTVACKDDEFEGSSHPDISHIRPGTERPKEERTDKHTDPMEYQTSPGTDTAEEYSTSTQTLFQPNPIKT